MTNSNHSTQPQRRHPRRTVDLWAIERGEGFMSWHRVSNVSEEGLFFEASMPLPTGTALHLDIELPGGQTVRTSASVVHATAGARDTGIGVRITELAGEDRAHFESFLSGIPAGREIP